jgi:xyloglucan-specific exo-beta-1,4-glucanase
MKAITQRMNTEPQRHKGTKQEFASCLSSCLCVFVALCFAFQATAQSTNYTWKNVKVVAGGFIPNIIFSPLEKNLAYCRTDIGGCYRWDDSTKKWLPLTDFLKESNYFGGESLALDPTDANTVYIAAGMYSNEPAAMLRSRDKGKTWDVFPVSFRMGGNEDGRGVGERLAVDPNDPHVLYFASRHEGLWKSTDSAEHWEQVESFPLQGLGNPSRGQRAHTGLSFIIFNPPQSARKPTDSNPWVPTSTIFVASADPGDTHLFHSTDAGKTWSPIPNGPDKSLLPLRAVITDSGILYITYANNPGPNGATTGAVYKLNTQTNEWADVTPDKGPNRSKGGYCGISLDHQHPATLAVSTLNHWSPIDTIYRSTDDGQSWNEISAKAQRDVSISPYLFWGDPQPKLGWWMAAFAIDPFDGNHAVYATGATMYDTHDFSNVSENKPTHWSVWADGIEETAVITLMSPTAGPHLLSGFGDIGGFTHDDLDTSPAQGMHSNPIFNNTNTLDYAGQKPNVIVRSGQAHGNQPTLAYSEDGGHTWNPLAVSQINGQANGRFRSTPAIIVSADASTFMLMTPTPTISRDHGKSWTPVTGLPPGARPIEDRAAPKSFYAFDFSTGKFFTSIDTAASFTQTDSTGLPSDIRADQPAWREAAWPLIATLDKPGDLWFVSKQGLFHSSNAGKTFAKIDSDLQIDTISFGKVAPGKDYPTLFAIATLNKLKSIYRSDDVGGTWIRVNDDAHQYGTRFRCIAGDPRVFGRVYVGTDGRGILCADLVDSK